MEAKPKINNQPLDAIIQRPSQQHPNFQLTIGKNLQKEVINSKRELDLNCANCKDLMEPSNMPVFTADFKRSNSLLKMRKLSKLILNESKNSFDPS